MSDQSIEKMVQEFLQQAPNLANQNTSVPPNQNTNIPRSPTSNVVTNPQIPTTITAVCKTPQSGVILEIREPTVIEKLQLKSKIPAYMTSGIEIENNENAVVYRELLRSLHYLNIITEQLKTVSKIQQLPTDIPFAIDNPSLLERILFAELDIPFVYLLYLALMQDFLLSDIQVKCEHCKTDCRVNVVIDPTIFSPYTITDLTSFLDPEELEEIKKSKSGPLAVEEVKDKREKAYSVITNLLVSLPTQKISPFITIEDGGHTYTISPYVLWDKYISTIEYQLSCFNVYKTNVKNMPLDQALKEIVNTEIIYEDKTLPAEFLVHLIAVDGKYIETNNIINVIGQMTSRQANRLKRKIRKAIDAAPTLEISMFAKYNCPACKKQNELKLDPLSEFFRVLLYE